MGGVVPVRVILEVLAVTIFHFMLQLITILNRCHRFPGFVYEQARFSSDHKSIEIARGGFVRLHFLMINTRTRSAVEALSWGVNRMPVKAAAVLLAAARTHLPTGRRRLLQSR